MALSHGLGTYPGFRLLTGALSRRRNVHDLAGIGSVMLGPLNRRLVVPRKTTGNGSRERRFQGGRIGDQRGS